jgi:hypothetical protein
MVLAIMVPCLLASGIWMAVTWEGIDSQRFGRKWQEVKLYVGLGSAGEDKKRPVSVKLPAEQAPDTSAVTVSKKPPPDTKAATVMKAPPATLQKDKQVNPPSETKTYRVYPEPDIERFFLAIVEGNVDVVQRYIKGGISPDIERPNHGDAPLFLAVAHRHDEVALLLIDAGADVAGNNNVGIPLIWAAEHCGSVKLVQALIASGADVNAKAKGGATPLMMAKVFKCPEIQKILLAAGAQ